ncbi:MAG: hypothetical protein H6585_09735 [Flavobacteriales bacterium]|nr:hypothetical protein [Flavobacteriales bacterium]MCB9448611.1 hypothetical protein [Flavobacteriales bacterium]
MAAKCIYGLSILLCLLLGCSSKMNEMNIAKKTVYRKNLEMKDATAYRESVTAYDRNGHVVKEQLFDPAGSVIRTVEYTYNGEQCAKEVHSDAGGTQLLTKDYTYTGGKLERVVVKGKQSSELDYSYDDAGGQDEFMKIDGQQKHQKHRDSNGKILWEVNLMDGDRTEYAYDENGNLTQIREEHKEGHTTIRYRNEYDAEGNLAKVYMNQILASAFVYENGRVVKEIVYAPDGSPEVEMTFEYELY